MTGSTRNGWFRLLIVATIGAAGLALSGCSVIGNILAGDEGVVEGEGVATDAFQIKVGDCLNDATAGNEVSVVPLIACSEPHDSEVFSRALMQGGPYPGDDAVFDFADEACVSAFAGFAGIAYEDSTLYFSHYSPTAESWDAGDREVLCIIYAVDANDEPTKTTGSLAGAAR